MGIKLFEINGEENKAGAESTNPESTGGGGSRVEKAQMKAPSAPETGAPDSEVDVDDLFGKYTSLIFLSGTGTGNIIREGDRLNMLEINKSMMSNFESIEFEDFQWICETKDFKKYLAKTGRKESTWDTNESEKISESHSSKVLNFDEYRKDSELYEDEKILSYSEYKENSIDESGLGDIVMPGMTEKGMKFKKKDPGFSGGALTENQRSYLKFYYTKNRFMHGDLRKEFSTSLDLEKIKTGEGNEIQIFTSYIDSSGKKYEESIISFGFRADQIIRPQGSLTKCVVVGTIFNIAPRVPQGESQGDSSAFEKIISAFNWAGGQLQDIFSTATGQIFGVTAGVSAAWGLIGAAGAGLLGWRALATFREATSTLQGIQGSIEAASAGRRAREAQAAKKVGIFNRLAGRVGRFVFYPGKVVQRYLSGSRAVVGAQRAAALSRLMSIRNTSRLRYVSMGIKSARLAKGAGLLAKASRAGSTLAKASNPIGWALLLTDLAVSTYNYTSDNQAPSWKPIIGDKTDALKNYASKKIGGDGTCPSATNKVIFSKLENGKQYTMCWTQGPNSGFGIALSFIASISTRTTIDMVKLKDISYGNKVLSIFIITNVNHKETREKIEKYALRLLVFKGNETYEEGIIDDNISAKLVLGNASSDPKEMLPMSYIGHTNNLLFTDTYIGSPDQLVTVDSLGPEEFTFHFEDSESNVINVWGKKIKENDLENASEEEVRSFFTKEPVSSYIGDPAKETEEEKEEREELEKKALSLKQKSQKELEKSEKKESSESSNIQTNESILSFNDFSRQKELGFVYESAIEDASSSNPIQQDFQKILNNSTSPAFFEIYFVTLREYADPSLRKTYSPGSFTNFLLTPEAISSSDGSDLSGEISINNYDVLLNVKKGLYSFDNESSQKEKERRENEEAEKLKGGKSQIEIRSSTRGQVFDLSRTPGKEKEEKKENLEKEGGLISKLEKDDIQSLNIGSWGDVTSVKAIRNDKGNIVKIKIKNRKASLDDKSREVAEGDPGFQSAIRLYDKYKESTEVSTSPEKNSLAMRK